MAATYEITDQVTHSKIVLKEGATALRFWAIPKSVTIEVENGYLSIFLGQKLVTPKIPRVFISIPASGDDETLFDNLAFMTKSDAASITILNQTMPWKQSVRARTTGDLTLSFPGGVVYNNGTAGVGATLTQVDPSEGDLNSVGLDGVTDLAVGDRVLIADEGGLGGQARNGIYEVANLGDGAAVPWQLIRVTDFDEAAEIFNAFFVTVTAGVTYSDTAWLQTTDSGTVGSTAILFVPFGAVSNIPSGNIRYVSTDGSDKDGTVGDRARPWLNPTVCIASAVSGDKVHILAGTYIIGAGGLPDNGSQYLVKDGVEVYMDEGVEIIFSDSGLGATQPFYDQNTPGNYTITGHGKITVNRGRNFFSPPNNFVMTTTGSNFYFRCKSLDLGSRWYFSNIGTTIDVVVEENMDTQTQFWAIRPAAQLSGRFVRFSIGKLDRSEYFASNPAWAHTDVRNLIDSQVIYEFGEHLSSDYFNLSTGGHYISNLDNTTITIKTRLATDQNPGTGIAKPYISMFGCSGSLLDWDVTFKDFRGQFCTVSTSNSNLTGKIKFSGNIPNYTAPAGGNSYIIPLGTESRLKINLNIDVASDHNFPVFYFHGCDDACEVSGSFRSRSATTPPIGPVNNAGFAAYTHAAFRNLVIETGFANCFDNVAGGVVTVPNVNVMDTFANVGPNAARITERVQTINVNANLKA